MMPSCSIDITGIGCISALGATYKETMISLYKGLCSAALPTRFSIDQPEEFPVFEVDDEQVNWLKTTANYNRTTMLALAAVNDALEDAKISKNDLRTLRVGVCIGTTVGNSLNNEKFYSDVQVGQHPPLDEIKRYLLSNPAEVIANELQLNGPVLTVANACASGTDAIGIGQSWFNNDMCDVVIAGGAEELSRISYLGFISLMIHSTKICTPFDVNRNGLNLGEGAAILILEKDKPKKRKCSVLGYGMGCDAYHLTAPHPDGLGLKIAQKQAMSQAKLEAVDAINAHGTGTKDNDKVEMKVFDQIFPDVPYFSVKGCTGHTLGAAGAIEAVISIGCLEHAMLPVSTGFSELDEAHIHPPLQQNISFSGSTILSQSLAFGGNNSVVIFGS